MQRLTLINTTISHNIQQNTVHCKCSRIDLHYFRNIQPRIDSEWNFQPDSKILHHINFELHWCFLWYRNTQQNIVHCKC